MPLRCIAGALERIVLGLGATIVLYIMEINVKGQLRRKNREWLQ
jgi:hypothetical protein